MEEKLLHVIEVKKGDNTYTFSMPARANVGEALDAAICFLSEVQKKANEITDLINKKREEAEKEKAEKEKEGTDKKEE